MMLVALLVLLVVVAAATETGIEVNKCCGALEMLDASGRKCGYFDIGHNFTLREGTHRPTSLYQPPFDEEWIRTWMPPGISMKKISSVWTGIGPIIFHQAVVSRVNTTGVYDEKMLKNESFWIRNVVLRGNKIIRRSTDGKRSLQAYQYCVDSTQDPSTDFVLVQVSHCAPADQTIRKCCRLGKSLIKNGKNLTCVPDKTRMNNVFYGRTLVELESSPKCGKSILRWYPVTASEVDAIDYCISPFEENVFSMRNIVCVDSILEGGNSTQLVNVYCEYSRITRGVFRLSRALPFASTLLLAAALATIARSRRMRSSAHGWALACHAACLLLFNVEQIAFYLTFPFDTEGSPSEQVHLMGLCNFFAFTMHFLLMAAASWLTAVSLNLSSGFRVEAAAGGSSRSSRGRGCSERRRFLWLSAGAWGFPVAVSAAAVAVTLAHAVPTPVSGFSFTGRVFQLHLAGPWYVPSFLETRTCFEDLIVSGETFRATKLGSLLFYFGPAGALVAANAVLLGRAARRMHALRRGCGLLQKGDESSTGRHGSRASVSQAQSVSVYVRLLLSAGLVEASVELGFWAASDYRGLKNHFWYDFIDASLAYRTAGFFTDLLRASCVLWLAAPGLPQRAASLWQRLRSARRGGAVKSGAPACRGSNAGNAAH